MTMQEPRAGQPHMPEYGLAPLEEDGMLLPWRWAIEHLREGHNYWITTASRDARPHSVPVWGVWHGDRFYFSTAPGSRKARDLAENPRIVVAPERGDEAVIVEGIAQACEDRALLATVAREYEQKYQWKMDLDAGPIFEVRPSKVFAFIETGDQFTKTATRWRFD
jgi:nitroimidazol reductase NimA-like FMN-containing flavoprotein (pyridoxamine 5'-phosphate oxidase superfamily)